MNPLFSMTATEEERVAYLEKNGPNVSLFDLNREISIILLRNGNQQRHTFFREAIDIVFPQSRSYYKVPHDAPDYFIYAPPPSVGANDEIIPLSKHEAEIIAQKIHELDSAADAEAEAAEADKECGYCGEKLGDCWGDHEEDDDCASITSTEVRVNARILAADELQQEKQAVHNQWAAARQNILKRHAELLDEEANKQLAERLRIQARAQELANIGSELEKEKQAVHNQWASARQRIMEVHEAREAADAAKNLAERMREDARIIEEYGSEEAFLKSRAAGEEAMRLIHTADRMRMATEGYKY